MENLTLNQLYHLTINSEYAPLDNNVIERLIKAVRIDFMKQRPFKTMDMISLYKDIEWKWMAARGNLTKRISKWYYDTYKAKLLQETSTAIGSLVREAIIKNQEYHFDFTRNFDWTDGDFADSGSCYLTSRRQDILTGMANDARFHAVRFFKELLDADVACTKIWYKENGKTEKRYTGISRAWLVKEDLVVKNGKMKVHKPFYILFNGYGYSTKIIASVLASMFSVSFKTISVSNNKALHGGLYLNDDQAYIIGDEAVIKNILKYDFGFAYEGELFSGKEIVLKDNAKVAKEKIVPPPNHPAVPNPFPPEPGFNFPNPEQNFIPEWGVGLLRRVQEIRRDARERNAVNPNGILQYIGGAN